MTISSAVIKGTFCQCLPLWQRRKIMQDDELNKWPVIFLKKYQLLPMLNK